MFANDVRGAAVALLRHLRHPVAPGGAASERDPPGGRTGYPGVLLGTATRSDGSTQVTYNGWPLYVWPPDRAPGHGHRSGPDQRRRPLVRALPRRQPDQDPVTVTAPDQTASLRIGRSRGYCRIMAATGRSEDEPGLAVVGQLDRLDPVDQLDGVDPLDRLGRLDPVDRLGRLDPVDRLGRLVRFAGLVRQLRLRGVGPVRPLRVRRPVATARPGRAWRSAVSRGARATPGSGGRWPRTPRPTAGSW